MEKDEIISAFSQEFKRGTLVLCVLSRLGKPTYGYNLIRMLTDGGVPVEANTLYPLLRRLEGQGLLQSAWDTQGVKPRKYYNTTELGDEVFLELRAQWAAASASVNALMEGETNAE